MEPDVDRTLPRAILPICRKPFRHVVADGWLPQDWYLACRDSFPLCPPSTGPSGRSLFLGDEQLTELCNTSEAWANLLSSFRSQAFVDACQAQFRESFASPACTMAKEPWRYVEHIETREEKGSRFTPRSPLEPLDVYVRFDVHQAPIGYKHGHHIDHRRRLVTFILYFSDCDDIGMTGGDLQLHGRPRPILPARQVTVQSRENRIVWFPCSPDSLHSVSEIVTARAPRQYVQVHVSRTVDAWAT